MTSIASCVHIYSITAHPVCTLLFSNWVLPKQAQLTLYGWIWLFKGDVAVAPQYVQNTLECPVHSLRCSGAQDLARQVQVTSIITCIMCNLQAAVQYPY